MNTTEQLTSKRDQLNDQIASAPVGQDVASLLAARDWYNARLAATEFRVYWANHQYYSDRVAATLEEAIQIAKDGGFDAWIYQVLAGANPYKAAKNHIGSWSAIGGFRRSA